MCTHEPFFHGEDSFKICDRQSADTIPKVMTEFYLLCNVSDVVEGRRGGDGKTRATMHTSGQKKYKHSLFTHRNRIPKHFKWIVNGTRLHQLALTMSLIQMKFAMWHWSIRTVVFARKCLYTIFIFICIFISVSISLFCVIAATTFFSFWYEVCCVCAFFRHYQ